MTLDEFVQLIPEFDKSAASKKIDYLVYYHTVTLENEGIDSRQIEDYFDCLRITKYSNTRQ